MIHGSLLQLPPLCRSGEQLPDRLGVLAELDFLAYLYNHFVNYCDSSVYFTLERIRLRFNSFEFTKIMATRK